MENPDEHVYANQFTLTQEVSAAKPVISPGGVLSAAANVPGLTPGSWVAIYGQNLSQTTRSWTAADFHGNLLPTSLDGVSVSIDPQAAAVSYVSVPRRSMCRFPMTLRWGRYR